jgi:hypothetical protein
MVHYCCGKAERVIKASQAIYSFMLLVKLPYLNKIQSVLDSD